MPTVRASQPLDLPAITAIYRHYVLHNTATFEIDPPSLADMTQRRQTILDKQLPWLVAEGEDGTVLGYAYANHYHARPAFRFTVENSIYIADSARGQGIGKLLLQALCQACETAGMRTMVAVIGDSNNAGSIGLHRSEGFSHAGTLRHVGWKLGQWLDVVMMEKSIGAGASTAPE